MAEAARGRVGSGADHPVRLERALRPFRLRGQGLRPVAVDREEAGPADGPVRTAHPRGCAPSRGGRRARHRGRRGSDRRVDRHGHRRDQVVPGLLRHTGPARARPGEPLRDPLHHPEHGGRLGLDAARHARPALVGVHRLRGLEHGDRPGRGRHPARPRGRHALRWHRVGDQRGRNRRLRRDAGAVATQRRAGARKPPLRRRARRLRHGRGRRRPRARGAWSVRVHAAPGSTPRSPATGCRPMPPTSRSRIPQGRTRHVR